MSPTPASITDHQMAQNTPEPLYQAAENPEYPNNLSHSRECGNPDIARFVAVFGNFLDSRFRGNDKNAAKLDASV